MPEQLRPLPPTFHHTRDALHRLATHVVYLPRREATGRYGLIWTPGGFGTPFFGDDEQIRVTGDMLVHQRRKQLESAPITTLRAGAELLGRTVDPDFDHGFDGVVPVGDPDAALGVDEASALALGDWYSLATSVLEQLRDEWSDRDPTAVQLWPEHFDLAFDLAVGEPADRARVNVGASPGDDDHPDPYFYVGPWTDDRPGDPEYWDAGFGATLPYATIVAAGRKPDQRDCVLEFLREGVERLRSV
ncbi:MAG: hypothetical protein ACSLFO_10045 [Acidimicrobiales bacterium]